LEVVSRWGAVEMVLWTTSVFVRGMCKMSSNISERCLQMLPEMELPVPTISTREKRGRRY
jgi:hypothetical protein